MASEYETALAAFSNNYVEAAAWKAYAITYYNNALINWNAGNDHAAIRDIIEAWTYLNTAIDFMLGFYQYPYPTYRPVQLFDLVGEFMADPPIPPPYDLTLVKMIEAYIGADDDHRSGYTLIEDAYRASMYDKPFDMEYHTGWVQRFRSWA